MKTSARMNDSSSIQDEVRQALEDFRSTLREDLRAELQTVQEAVRDIQTILSSRAPVVNLPAQQLPRAQTLSIPPSVTLGCKDPGSMSSRSNPVRSRQMVPENPSYVRLKEAESDDDEPQIPAGVRKWIARAHVENERDSKDAEQGATFVESPQFETVVGVIVLANALFIGVEAEAACVYHMDVPTHMMAVFQVVETCFTTLYSIEWLLRVYFQRCDFFAREVWRWNLLDTFLLMSQLIEKFLLVFMLGAQDVTAEVLGLIRSLRLLRIVRLVRLLRLFKDLGTLVASIVSSFNALIWALTLMLTMVYGFSVFFAHRVYQVKQGYLSETLDYFYHDVPRTALTMIECILGGISWDEPVMSLFTEVGVPSGCLCVFFIMTGLFVLVNIVSGVFIDKVMRTADAEEDRAIAEDLAIAFGLRDGGMTRGEVNSSLDYQSFKSKIHEPAMHRYFEKMDLEVDEGHLRKFFNLLDTDGSGNVSGQEMYAGCLRLRGGLRAIDLALQTYDQLELFRYQQRQLERIEQLVANLSRGQR